jgi:type IV secretory pathway component VirB8
MNFITNLNFNKVYGKYNIITSNFYISENLNTSNTLNYNSLIESSNNVRALKNHNLLINYDYKTGHYLGSWDQLFPFLFNSFIEVSRGIRKAP